MSLHRLQVVSMVALLLLAAMAAPAKSAKRMMLFEEFTNNDCPICAVTADAVHQIMVDYDEVLAPVVWHTWWPNAADPLYLHSPASIRRRVEFYGVGGVPDGFFDGQQGGISFINTYDILAWWIRLATAVPSPLTIAVAVKVTPEAVLAKVNVTVETPTAYGTHRLYVALVEKDIYLPSPNGQERHYWTFRRINNNDAAEAGEPIDISTAGSQQFEYDGQDFPMHPDYQPAEMAVCAWVQEVATHNVLQAGKGDSPYLTALEYGGPHTRIGAGNEVTHYAATLHNTGFDGTYDVMVSGVPAGWACSYTTPAGTFSGPSSLALPESGEAPITIDLDSQGNPGCGKVTLTCTSQGNSLASAALDFHKLNGADVLLVDDDGGAGREERLGEALDARGAAWGTWDREWGELDAEDLATAADVTVWLTGDHVPTLSEADRSAISGLLDDGGKLLLTGQEIAYDLADPMSPSFSMETILWFVNVLHANYVNTFSSSYFLDGVAGDPIGDGLAFALEPGGPSGQTSMDTIMPGYSANGVCTYRGVPNWYGGLRWTDGRARLVFLSFGLEGVYEADQRQLLLGRVLGWFESSAAVDAAAPPLVPFSLFGSRPNPAAPATVIQYWLSAVGPVNLRIYDVGGRLVRTLVDGWQAATEHRHPWNGRDDAGRLVPSGVYFYRLEAGGQSATERLVVVR